MNKRLTAAEEEKVKQESSTHFTEHLGNGGFQTRNRSALNSRQSKHDGYVCGEDNSFSGSRRSASSSGVESRTSIVQEGRTNFRAGLKQVKARASAKKVNLKNCLNFHFENRQIQVPRRTNLRRKPPVSVFNREEYVQANYKLDISDAVDIAKLTNTADPKIDWEDILQVEMAVSEDYRCPISLESPPICPQITPCGHVFSYSSIIEHLMSKGGPTLFCPVSCPMCYTPFVAKALRNVSFTYKEVPKTGHYWRFVLMKRDRKMLVPEQVTDDDNVVNQAGLPQHQRFTVQKDVTKHFETLAKELAEAASKFTHEEDREEMFELQSYLVALDNLSIRAKEFEARRLEKLSELGKKKWTNDQIQLSAQNLASTAKKAFHESLGSIKTLNIDPTMPGETSSPETAIEDSIEHEELDIEWNDPDLIGFDSLDEDPTLLQDESPQQIPVELGDHYYFYQSEDSQWIFLHPVNINCLLKHYRHFEHFPRQLSGRIVDIEEIIQSEMSRKRIRHLSHLPRYATMQLIELDLSQLLPKSCLGAVVARHARKQKKAKEEDRLEQGYGQDEYYQQGFMIPPPRQTLDMESMPPLSSSSQCVSESEIQKQKEWKGAYSFANVTKTGHVPRAPTNTIRNTDGLSTDFHQIQQDKSSTGMKKTKKNKGGNKKKKIVLFG